MIRILAVVIGLGLSLSAVAASSPVTELEITFLLAYIGYSDCEFYRNGTWYQSKTAQAHVRGKYEYLARQDQINSAEDFIDKAASASSFTRRPYQVRCGGGQPVSSAQWLTEALARFRAVP